MTKILSRKCAVPDKSGDVKLNSCDFNILYAIQMDIETYNYADIVFHVYRQGKIVDYTEKIKKQTEQELNPMGLNAGVAFLPIEEQPSFMTFKRFNADFMNNFFVNIVARSFTDFDEYLKQQQENAAQSSEVKTMKELQKVKSTWKDALL